MLAKALAHSFEAKLLFLDVTDFSLKVGFFSISISRGFDAISLGMILQMQSKYGSNSMQEGPSV